MKQHIIFKIICYIVIITFSFGQFAFAKDEIRACLAAPNFFNRPCEVVFEKGNPTVKVLPEKRTYKDFMDIPESVVKMFLITLLAELFDNKVEDEVIVRNLIEQSIVKRFQTIMLPGNLGIQKIERSNSKLTVIFNNGDKYIFSSKKLSNTSSGINVSSGKDVFFTCQKQDSKEEILQVSEYNRDIAFSIVKSVLKEGKDIEACFWENVKGREGLEFAEFMPKDIDLNTVVALFELEKKEEAQGKVFIVRDNHIPIAVAFKQGNDLKVFNIFEYFARSKTEKEIFSEKVSRALVFSGFFTGLKGSVENILFPGYLRVVYDDKGAPKRLLLTKQYSKPLKGNGFILPLLPGVYLGNSSASLMAGKAAWKYVKEGDKVLVIGSGAGVDTRIAAEKGATVDAVDIKRLASENTRLTSKFTENERHVNSFVNDLFDGLGEYDVVIFNMPHVNGFSQQHKDAMRDVNERDSTDFGGVLLLRTLEKVKGHLSNNGKAILINSNEEHLKIKDIIQSKTDLLVSTDDFGMNDFSRAYILQEDTTAQGKKKSLEERKKERSMRLVKKWIAIFIWSLILAPTELHNQGIPVLAAIAAPILVIAIIVQKIKKKKKSLERTVLSNNKITPLSGINGPSGSAFLFNVEGMNIMFDAGMDPTSRQMPDLSGIDKLDYLLISHAHLDHTGAIGHVMKKFPDVKIIASDITLEAAYIMLAGGIRSRNKKEKPQFTRSQVRDFYNNSISLRMDKWYKLSDKIKIKFIPAGHIFGASAIIVATESGNYMYSGDISVKDQVSLKGFSFPNIEIDSVVSEALYGDRVHEQTRQQKKKVLADIISKTVKKGGSVLIPSFAMGRSTEIALTIKELQANGEIPNVPVYIDGMAAAMTKIYEEYKDELLPEEMQKMIDSDGNLFFGECSNIKEVKRHMRDEVLLEDQPHIVIAGSGMLIGGRALHYFEKMASDQKNSIIIVGYQAARSLGRRIMGLKKGEKVRFKIQRGNKVEKVEVPLNASVHRASFSAHADQIELVDFMKRVNAKQIILVHGAMEAKERLKKIFSEHAPDVDIVLPEKGKSITLYGKDRKELFEEKKAKKIKSKKGEKRTRRQTSKKKVRQQPARTSKTEDKKSMTLAGKSRKKDFEQIKAKDITEDETEQTKRMSKKARQKRRNNQSRFKKDKKPPKTEEQKRKEFIEYIIVDMFKMERTQKLYDHLYSVLEERFDGKIGSLRWYFKKYLWKEHSLNSTPEEMQALKDDLLEGYDRDQTKTTKPLKTEEQKRKEFIAYIIVDMFKMKNTGELYDHLMSVLDERFSGKIGSLREYFRKYLFKTHPLKSTSEEMENLKKDLLEGFDVPEKEEKTQQGHLQQDNNKKKEKPKRIVSVVKGESCSQQEEDFENSQESVREMAKQTQWDDERSIVDYDAALQRFGFSRFPQMLSASKVYIDAGCGNGVAATEVAYMYPQTQVYGVDILSRLDVSGMDNYNFFKGDIAHCQFPQKADLITSMFVFQYLKDPLKAFTNLYNQVNVNGSMLITFAATKQSNLSSVFESACNYLVENEMVENAFVVKYPQAQSDAFLVVVYDKRTEKPLEQMLRVKAGEWFSIYDGRKTMDVYEPQYEPVDVKEKNIEKNTLVLYADDLFSNVVFSDTDEVFNDLVKEKGLLYNGNLVLYVKNGVHKKAAEIFAQKIKTVSRGRTKVVIIEKQGSMLEDQADGNVGEEIDTLVRLLRSKGIKEENILTIVKAHNKELASLEYEASVPVVLLNLACVDKLSRGLFRFRDILFSAITAEGDPQKLIQILDPVAIIGISEAYERFILRSELIAASA